MLPKAFADRTGRPPEARSLDGIVGDQVDGGLEPVKQAGEFRGVALGVVHSFEERPLESCLPACARGVVRHGVD